MTPYEHHKRVSAAARVLAQRGVTWQPVQAAEDAIAAADQAVPVITGRELFDAVIASTGHGPPNIPAAELVELIETVKEEREAA